MNTRQDTTPINADFTEHTINEARVGDWLYQSATGWTKIVDIAFTNDAGYPACTVWLSSGVTHGALPLDRYDKVRRERSATYKH